MKFYCIFKDHQKITKDLLKKSALDRGLDFIEILSDDFKFYEDFFSESEKKEKAILYRIASGQQAKNVENQLLIENKNLITFYKNNRDAFFNVKDIDLQKFYNIPIIETISHISSVNIEYLNGCVKRLGGFPIIIKVTGKSHGEGVMKIESMNSLISVLGFLKKMDVDNMILRKFIDSYRHARMVVIGEKVVDSIEYIVPENDFRTNAGDPVVRAEKFPESFEEIAIKAVNSMNIEFGGVDILIDKDNKPHLAEVNFPCYFPRNQLTTNCDVSGIMVDFLISKAKRDDKK